MSSLTHALTGRGFAVEVSLAGIVATSPGSSVDVYIAPIRIDENDNVQIFFEGEKMATFYRQPDHTILTLVDHLLAENTDRKDDHERSQ